MTHADDWFGAQETGVLGHGHDGLAIDRIKHSSLALRPEPLEKTAAMIAQAVMWSLEGETHKLDPASREILLMFLNRYMVPEALTA